MKITHQHITFATPRLISFTNKFPEGKDQKREIFPSLQSTVTSNTWHIRFPWKCLNITDFEMKENSYYNNVRLYTILLVFFSYSWALQIVIEDLHPYILTKLQIKSQRRKATKCRHSSIYCHIFSQEFPFFKIQIQNTFPFFKIHIGRNKTECIIHIMKSK